MVNCLMFFILLFVDVRSDCILSMNTDLGDPSPVYIKDGGYLAPNMEKGDIRLLRSETVIVGCPGDRRHVVVGNQTMRDNFVNAKCVSNTTFRVGKWRGKFNEISCNTQPWFTTEEAGKCGGNTLYRVGYRINEKFYTLYEACFNKDLLTTVYVKSQVKPENKYLEKGSRPQFIEGSLFGKVRMSKLYKIENQKARLDELIGKNGNVDEYFNKTRLTRGHLAPRADFALRGQQRASFHYVNTAPQWMLGNAGDWAALEEAIRRVSHTRNTPLTVYTGTSNVFTPKHTINELYLTSDANNNGLVPVPMYFYKVVYNPKDKTATAFISINSSFYSKRQTDELSFCSDICDDNPKFSWLKWRSDGTHSFCCDYDEFIEKINTLPKLDVKGRFY